MEEQKDNDLDTEQPNETADDEKPRKSIAVETKIEASDGVMNVKVIGLRKPVKNDRKFSCAFDDNCEEFFTTQGELNKHLQSVHKATFKCPKCEHTYDTANKYYKKHLSSPTSVLNEAKGSSSLSN